MHNSKLYSILEHFDKYEQNRCRKYIQSPYFNKNETLSELFDIMIDHINSGKKTEITKEKIWCKISDGQPYNDVRFRKHFSDLLKLIEGFLAQQIFEESPLHQATYLIEAVGKKKIDKLYNSTMKSARHLSNKNEYRASSYYYYQYQIEKNFYDLTETETKRTDRTNVEEIANYLDIFFLSEKLRIYCTVLNRQHLVSDEYKLLFLDEILSHIKKYDYENIPPIAIYYQIYLTTVDKENIDHYYKLKSLLEEHSLKFPQQEALRIYLSAINYCIRKINNGNLKFLEELFQVYNELIQKEIIFINNELSPWTFKNIVVLALRLGKYDWTEHFIFNYNQKIPDAFRENAVTFNLAQLYFYQKAYDKVIEQLRNVEYEDVSYNLVSKSMLIATYYETEEHEPLHSLFESFRVYLNRHSNIPETKRKNYKNLIKFTKKLTKIMPGDQKAIQKIKEEVAASKNIASMNWLKEKIAELE